MPGTRPSLLAAPALLLAVGSAVAGCAAGAPERRAVTPVAWPAPPAAPIARLARLLPDPDAPRPSRPWWRVALDVVTGAESQAGADPGALVRPFGVAFEADGTLVVADPDGGRVVRFDAQGRPRDVTCKDRPWAAPISLSSTGAGELYVADAGAGVVVRWSTSGCSALGSGELERPTGVALAGGRVWVADPPRHQLVAFDPSGALVARIGARGDGPGQFQFPSALASTADGALLVVDTLNFRIARLDADGRWLSSFGSAGQAGAGLARPKGIAVDAGGRVWITDAQRDTILAFGPDGALLGAVGESGDAPGYLAHPAGIATLDGRLAVADSQNHRVQVFEIIGGPP